jgi:hypothetical protein
VLPFGAVVWQTWVSVVFTVHPHKSEQYDAGWPREAAYAVQADSAAEDEKVFTSLQS